MFDIGLLELLIVAVVVIVVLGPEQIPGAVRSGAKTIFWFVMFISIIQVIYIN